MFPHLAAFLDLRRKHEIIAPMKRVRTGYSKSVVDAIGVNKK